VIGALVSVGGKGWKGVGLGMGGLLTFNNWLLTVSVGIGAAGWGSWRVQAGARRLSIIKNKI
jgi:hypothetical protein